MNEQQILARRRSAGFAAFFFSGVCAISSGVVVSLLQEQYGFAYGVTGTLLSLMNIGNLVAGFLSGVLPGLLGGMKRSVLLLSLGYLAGYGLMGFTGAVALLGLGFFLVGAAKGQVINTCTVLVGDSSPDRTRGMNIMHSCYACGALLCPFVIAAAGRAGEKAPLFLLALLGAALWLAFAVTPMGPGGKKAGGRIDWSFLGSVRFWLLMGLIFCQNAAETSVTGWMVTYFKDSGIIAGVLSTYTVTVMWGATLVARLLIAFVFPFKNPRKAMVVMGAGCIVTYFGLMLARSRRMTTVTSIAILLPAASLGAIVMPWIIGVVAETAGLAAGMASNIVPCVGMLLFAALVARLPEEEAA